MNTYIPVYIERNKQGNMVQTIASGFTPMTLREARICQVKLTFGKSSAIQSVDTGQLSHHSNGRLNLSDIFDELQKMA